MAPFLFNLTSIGRIVKKKIGATFFDRTDWKQRNQADGII